MKYEIFCDENEWTGNSISFQLTNKGTKHINLITHYLYKYLNLLLITSSNDNKLNNIHIRK